MFQGKDHKSGQREEVSENQSNMIYMFNQFSIQYIGQQDPSFPLEIQMWDLENLTAKFCHWLLFLFCAFF